MSKRKTSKPTTIEKTETDKPIEIDMPDDEKTPIPGESPSVEPPEQMMADPANEIGGGAASVVDAYPRAVVREDPETGGLVLDDPDAREVIQVMERVACRETAVGQIHQINHFHERAIARGNPEALLIVLINVDSLGGAELADRLMPDHNWQSYRDQGQVPFARGLVERAGFQEMLDNFASTIGQALAAIEGMAVLVFDHDGVQAFSVAELSES